MPEHKLIRQSKGADLWGQCSCGMWAWLGTYHLGGTGQRTRSNTLKREYARHVYLAETSEGI